MLLIILVTISSVIALFFCGMTAWQILATLDHRLDKIMLSRTYEGRTTIFP